MKNPFFLITFFLFCCNGIAVSQNIQITDVDSIMYNKSIRIESVEKKAKMLFITLSFDPIDSDYMDYCINRKIYFDKISAINITFLEQKELRYSIKLGFNNISDSFETFDLYSDCDTCFFFNAVHVKRDYDLIYLINGEIITSKITNISTDYIRLGTQDSVKKSDISTIKYNNGKIEIFSSASPIHEVAQIPRSNPGLPTIWGNAQNSKYKISWSKGLKFSLIPFGSLGYVWGYKITYYTDGSSKRETLYESSKLNEKVYCASANIRINILEKASGFSYGFGLRPQIVSKLQNENLTNNVSEVNFSAYCFFETPPIAKTIILFSGFEYGLANLYTKKGTKYYFNPKQADLTFSDSNNIFAVQDTNGFIIKMVDNRNFKVENTAGSHFEFFLGTKLETNKKIKPFLEIGIFESNFKLPSGINYSNGARSGLIKFSVGFDF
jgi:hypothetical protein